QHEAMLKALTTGDEIVTSGGIYGTITNVKEDRFVVRIADNTKIEIGKGFVSAVVKKNGEAKSGAARMPPRGRDKRHATIERPFKPKPTMFRRNLWKIAICLAIVLWAAGTLLPLQDQPFADYVKEHATAKTSEFNALLSEATAMKNNGQALSEFVAL